MENADGRWRREIIVDLVIETEKERRNGKEEIQNNSPQKKPVKITSHAKVWVIIFGPVLRSQRTIWHWLSKPWRDGGQRPDGRRRVSFSRRCIRRLDSV